MTPTPKGPIVLLVEDDEDNRVIYATMLRHHGYVVEEVATGSEAMVEARRLSPDLVLLDISLPGIDGWTVARELKQDPDTRHISVVAVSAHAPSEDRQKARELGFAAFLAKPVRPRRILEVVEELVPKKAGSSSGRAE